MVSGSKTSPHEFEYFLQTIGLSTKLWIREIRKVMFFFVCKEKKYFHLPETRRKLAASRIRILSPNLYNSLKRLWPPFRGPWQWPGKKNRFSSMYYIWTILQFLIKWYKIIKPATIYWKTPLNSSRKIIFACPNVFVSFLPAKGTKKSCPSNIL